jgi:hypothetical protein
MCAKRPGASASRARNATREASLDFRVVDALLVDQIDALVGARQDLADPIRHDAYGGAAGSLRDALPPPPGQVRATDGLGHLALNLRSNPPAARPRAPGRTPERKQEVAEHPLRVPRLKSPDSYRAPGKPGRAPARGAACPDRRAGDWSGGTARLRASCSLKKAGITRSANHPPTTSAPQEDSHESGSPERNRARFRPLRSS